MTHDRNRVKDKKKARLTSVGPFRCHSFLLQPRTAPGGARSAELLLFVDDLVVRFNHVVSRFGRGLSTGCCSRRLPRFGLCTGLTLLLIEGLPGLAEHLRQLLLRGADLVHVVAAKRLACSLDGGIDLGLRVRS